MNIIYTKIQGLYIIEPSIYNDNRGYFFESYNYNEFKEKIGDIKFVQDNESKSVKGVLRGLHFQNPPYEQAKLVKVVKGEVFDVAVDLRKDSPTYGQYVSVILSENNHKQFFIPRGFAHGFLVLSDEAIFQYKCDNFYNKESEDGIAWDDKTINIDWPKLNNIILSDKDKNRKTL
jgi:dTDP-4-dehydrorhamnose 3,5-epimerase